MHGISILAGGGRTLLELANCLAERGHEVTITTLKYKGELELLKKANFTPKFKILFAPLAGGFPYRVVKRLAKGYGYALYPYIENQALLKVMPECDINVGTVSYTAFPVYESGKGKPFHHFMHYEPVLFDQPKDIEKKRLIEETYCLPTVKILNSSWLKETLEVELGIRVPQENIVTHGFMSQYFYPRPEIKKDPKKKRIISLGKSIALKGLADLIAAFRILYEKNKALELVLFTPEKNLKVPSEFPIEVHYGVVNEELCALYNSADVMVMPSWFESFPWPPLEAMASGTPVVTTRYGTEEMATNEVNALVIDPKSPEQMASAIARLLEDKTLRDRLIVSGLQTVKRLSLIHI